MKYNFKIFIFSFLEESILPSKKYKGKGFYKLKKNYKKRLNHFKKLKKKLKIKKKARNLNNSQ